MNEPGAIRQEIAAAERAAFVSQPAPSTTKRSILIAAALGFAVVGLVMVAISPQTLVRTQSSETTTPWVTRRASGAIGVASQVRSTTPAAVPVVPVGDGGYAVASLDAIDAAPSDDDTIQVSFPNGVHARGRVVAGGDDAALLVLDRTGSAYTVAATPPAADDAVTIVADVPIDTTFGALGTVAGEAPEGSPILDRRGFLVGLTSSGTPYAVAMVVDECAHVTIVDC